MLVVTYFLPGAVLAEEVPNLNCIHNTSLDLVAGNGLSS